MRLPRRIAEIARAAMLPGLLATAACTQPGLPPPTSAIPVPDRWNEPVIGNEAGDIARYWDQLGDPDLVRLVDQALLENRDLAQAAARLDQARAQLRGARAGFLPQINASGGAQRDVGDLARDDVQFSLGADASWELDLFGRISGSVAASDADLAAAGYSLADLQRAIAGQMSLSVITARLTAQQLAITRSSLAYQEDNLQIALWRNQAGLVSSLDVEQARTQRAQTAAAIPQLQASLAATANAISTLAGEPPGRVLALLDDASAPLPRPAATAGMVAPAEVLRRRPDVRAAESTLLAAGARVGVARAQLLPLVRLTGNIGTASPASDLFGLVTGGLFASVGQLLFDGGRTRAQIESAEATARGALAAWEGTILAALEQVETAAVARRTAQDREAILTEALDAADASAILARSQYQAGLTDFRTVLTAESQLLSARNALVTAQADQASAFVRLTQALGGGWSPDQFPLPAGDRIPR
jgi:NodT family efflux transporter outer membrane factor (OMF) lipoprotein